MPSRGLSILHFSRMCGETGQVENFAKTEKRDFRRVLTYFYPRPCELRHGTRGCLDRLWVHKPARLSPSSSPNRSSNLFAARAYAAATIPSPRDVMCREKHPGVGWGVPFAPPWPTLDHARRGDTFHTYACFVSRPGPVIWFDERVSKTRTWP